MVSRNEVKLAEWRCFPEGDMTLSFCPFWEKCYRWLNVSFLNDTIKKTIFVPQLSSLYFCKSCLYSQVPPDAHLFLSVFLGWVSVNWFPAHLGSLSVDVVFGLFGWLEQGSYTPSLSFLSGVLGKWIIAVPPANVPSWRVPRGVGWWSGVGQGSRWDLEEGFTIAPCRRPGDEHWSIYCSVVV